MSKLGNVFDDVLEVVGTAAPLLATALVGPVGGVAVRAISRGLLGRNDATEQEVLDAIRMATLALGTALFLPLVHGNWLYFLWKDRQLTNIPSALRAIKWLYFAPGIFTRAFVIDTLPFLSPRFHPWDADNREVIHAWKRAYEETGDAQQAYQAFRQWHDDNRRDTTAERVAAA